jgi:hypothetical protein
VAESPPVVSVVDVVVERAVAEELNLPRDSRTTDTCLGDWGLPRALFALQGGWSAIGRQYTHNGIAELN